MPFPVQARLRAERISSSSAQERHDRARKRRGVRVFDLDDGMSELVAVLPAVLAHGAFDRLTQLARDVREAEAAGVDSGDDGANEGGDGAGHRCDGFDGDGQVVNVGREHRLFTARQRIGLAVRDGGCRWPGCDRPPSWCEAHHIDEWKAHGGRTDIADGVLLCRFHHLYVHDRQWRIRRQGRAEYFAVKAGQGGGPRDGVRRRLGDEPRAGGSGRGPMSCSESESESESGSESGSGSGSCEPVAGFPGQVPMPGLVVPAARRELTPRGRASGLESFAVCPADFRACRRSITCEGRHQARVEPQRPRDDRIRRPGRRGPHPRADAGAARRAGAEQRRRGPRRVGPGTPGRRVRRARDRGAVRRRLGDEPRAGGSADPRPPGRRLDGTRAAALGSADRGAARARDAGRTCGAGGRARADHRPARRAHHRPPAAGGAGSGRRAGDGPGPPPGPPGRRRAARPDPQGRRQVQVFRVGRRTARGGHESRLRFRTRQARRRAAAARPCGDLLTQHGLRDLDLQ